MKLIKNLVILSLVLMGTSVLFSNLVAKKHVSDDETYEEYDESVDEETTDETTDKPVGIKALPQNYKEVLDLLTTSKDKATTTWSSLRDTYHSLKDKWQSLKKIMGWPSISKNNSSNPKEDALTA